MTTYTLIIKAEVEAKNFDSAKKKADKIKETLARHAETPEVELRPRSE
jgi:hypothetical protein